MERPLAVELAGYLSAAVGVGEAARRYVAALRSVGVEVLERDVPLPGRDSAVADFVPSSSPRPTPDSVSFNLVCLNPEQMIPYLDGPDSPPRAGRHTIGIWSWEVDILPKGWADAAAKLDDIWTYSSFAADLIGAGVGVQVKSIPPSVSPVSGVLPPIALPDGFTVLTMFDFLSTMERKNPLGAIDAFKRAFRAQDGSTLIVKSVNGRYRPERQAEIVAATEGRSDIVLVDQTMSGSERDGLIAACDCFLSLHRSEGHGMPLAEAMAAGKPVVATDFGGNTEFMTKRNSYLVPYTPTKVGIGVEHYPQDASWAEPDIEVAARLLRGVVEHREDAMRHAAQGRLDVLAKLSPHAVGARILADLEQLMANDKKRHGSHPVERLLNVLRGRA
jgi:glycosyltransferase involved in cell wall biosynthesis